MQILALSAYRNCVAKNQAQQLTFPDVFRSFEVVDLYTDETNTVTGF